MANLHIPLIYGNPGDVFVVILLEFLRYERGFEDVDSDFFFRISELGLRSHEVS